MVFPYMLGFVILFIIPFFISFFSTFTNGVGKKTFVWIKNYKEVLGSTAFQLAFYNTFRFLIVSIPLALGISLMLACFVNQEGKEIFQGIFLYPMVLPTASVVMFFQVLWSDKGIINYILHSLNIPVLLYYGM